MMKKRLLSLLLILVLAISLSAAAWAGTDVYVWDETGHISSEELEILRQLGARIYDATGETVCVCITNETGDDVHQYAEEFWQKNINESDGIILVHNPSLNTMSFALYGERMRSLEVEEISELLVGYNSGPSYFEGAKNFMNLVYARLGGVTVFGEVSPEDNPLIPEERQLARVVDLAGVIDSARLSRLNELADQISEKYECDVAVAFVPSLEGRYVVDYADDFYDYKGHGYGPNDDGILLLVSVGDREFAETTYGYGKTAFTDYGMTNYLEPRFTRYLGSNDWAGAAEQFINDSGALLEQARNGKPYDYYEPERVQKSFKDVAPVAALISAVVGFFSGGIPTAAMKSKMKSVAKNYGAANYARGGLNLRASDDRFLYANVSKTPIPRQTEHRSGGGGGGSTVHFSSSGRSHGGSHGHF